MLGYYSDTHHRSVPKALLISSCITAANPSLNSDSASHDKSSNYGGYQLEYLRLNKCIPMLYYSLFSSAVQPCVHILLTVQAHMIL